MVGVGQRVYLYGGLGREVLGRMGAGIWSP